MEEQKKYLKYKIFGIKKTKYEKQYEYEKIVDNAGSCGYFGFGPGTPALAVFYEVGRIDKLTKKVTFHNYN